VFDQILRWASGVEEAWGTIRRAVGALDRAAARASGGRRSPRQRGRAGHGSPRLEQLCRYLLRPAVAQDRLRRPDDGRIVLTLKTASADGTRHLIFEPTRLTA
jgi:hypothetical protein